MSVTQARPRAATEDRLHSDLRKLWAALGPGPWTVQGANPDHALAQEILNVRYAGAPIKDLAAASVWIEYLVARGFLTRTQHADNPRVLIYEKAAAIPEPDRRTWAEREQAQLDAAARRERALFEEQARFAAQLAEQRATVDPRMNEIAAALRRLHVLDREGVQQVTAAAVAEAVQPLREQVAALAQQLAAIAEQLAEASQADQSTTTQARRFGRRAN